MLFKSLYRKDCLLSIKLHTDNSALMFVTISNNDQAQWQWSEWKSARKIMSVLHRSFDIDCIPSLIFSLESLPVKITRRRTTVDIPKIPDIMLNEPDYIMGFSSIVLVGHDKAERWLSQLLQPIAEWDDLTVCDTVQNALTYIQEPETNTSWQIKTPITQ